MVSVRKSHQMSEASFEQWLGRLELEHDKKIALEKLYHQVNDLFDDATPCQTKSLEMVEILSALNLDTDSLCAAFICPLYEYNCISLEYIEENFSQQIYLLCKGVGQMEAIKALQQSQSSKVSANQIDNIRRMLLAMVEDVRAVVIKLAERLCHLRLVKNSDEETRVLAAKETSNIYAPLANRLGIGQLKWELEDLSFRYLHPDVYKKIAKQLDETRLERERYMADFVGNISQQLQSSGIKGVVYGRPKHIYSIWKKMQQKSLDFEQLFDVRGYQSIHTVVLGPEGKAIEVQIRTQQMHDDAELGVAAHWRYKEGNASGKTSGFDEKVSWLRKILQWQEDVSESGELLDELRSQVFEDRIYVFTPSGDVVDLPSGSTPLDFAYYIHSNVGHSCIGAKVFGRIVPFTHTLQTGDKVEILRSKTLNPSRDWLNPSLNYLHTSRARAKVQHFFRLLDRDKNLAAGKEMLETALAKLQLSLAKVDLSAATERFNLTTNDDLFAAIGSGNARLLQVVNFLQQQNEKLKPKEEIDPQSLIKQPQQADDQSGDNNGITVSGVGNLLTHMAKCCHPVPGDEISGFITQGRGISVHRLDCEQLANALEQQPEREVEVQWGSDNNKSYQVSINIIGGDRQGLLRDISTIISNERVSIIGIESHTDHAKQSMSMTIKVEVANHEVLSRLLAKLKQLDDVVEVKRL